MFRNITLGQYYPAESVLHVLDPRVKLFGALVWIISIFLMDGLFSFLLATGFLMFLIIISKVPFSFMVRGLRSIMIIVIIASVFNIFFTPGNTLVEAGPLKITDKGIINAVLMAIRMFYLIIGTSLMTLTTTPNNLTDGLSRSLSPLEAPCPGDRYRDDDDDSASLHSHPHRRNKQDNEGADGSRS